MEDISFIDAEFDFELGFTFDDQVDDILEPEKVHTITIGDLCESATVLSLIPPSVSADENSSVKNESDIVTKRKISKRVSGGSKRKRSVNSRKMKVITAVPNMSRRAKHSVLVAFPAFDKCDSLLFFSTTLTRLSNSGDAMGMKKLFETHFHSKCTTFYKGVNLDMVGTMKLLEMFNLLYPDSVECVHKTNVIENTIVATAVAKFTASNSIYTALAKQLNGTPYQGLLPIDRGAYLRDMDFVDAGKKESFVRSEFPDTGLDFDVYANIHLKLTFDDLRRKVTHFDFVMEATSVQPVLPSASADA